MLIAFIAGLLVGLYYAWFIQADTPEWAKNLKTWVIGLFNKE